MAIKLFTLAQQTIATAGSRAQVSATPTPVTAIVVQAASTNTGNIFVGDDNVSSTRGIAVGPGQAVSINQDHEGREGGDEMLLSDFYVDTATNGNKVNVSYKARR